MGIRTLGRRREDTRSGGAARPEGDAEIADALTSQAERLSDAAGRLFEGTDRAAAAAAEMAHTIGTVAEGAAAQEAASADGRASVSAICGSLTEMAGDVERTHASAAAVDEKAREGADMVAGARAAMEEITRTLGDAGAAVERLSNRGQRIRATVETIAGIAAQTNLLALNAAIEAARAGEDGRGFAVVADEVRTLAVEADAAARTIRELIGEIGEDTESAATAFQRGGGALTRGGERMAAATETFSSIVAEAQVAGEAASSLSASADSLASAARETESQISRVAEISQENARSAERLAQMSDATVTRVEGLVVGAAGVTLSVGHDLTALAIAQRASAPSSRALAMTPAGERPEQTVAAIAAAIAAHGAWRERLGAALAGTLQEHPDPVVVGARDRCAFGKWLSGLTWQGERPQLVARIDEEHAAFHRLAAEVLEAVGRGDHVAAAALLGEGYGTTSRRLVGDLVSWSEALASGETGVGVPPEGR